MKNFRIIGEGGIYDSVLCTYRQGTWTNNTLNGATVFTNFLNSTVNIKVGPYTSNQPNGTISEYIFDKTLWAAFIADPPAGISATKNVRVYTSGSLTSTTSTATVNISGHVDLNSAGSVIGFSFVEVV